MPFKLTIQFNSFDVIKTASLKMRLIVLLL
nr:MAG TPA: hypothetical protein [Caudoviricetes sp.]